ESTRPVRAVREQRFGDSDHGPTGSTLPPTGRRSIYSPPASGSSVLPGAPPSAPVSGAGGGSWALPPASVFSCASERCLVHASASSTVLIFEKHSIAAADHVPSSQILAVLSICALTASSGGGFFCIDTTSSVRCCPAV